MLTARADIGGGLSRSCAIVVRFLALTVMVLISTVLMPTFAMATPPTGALSQLALPFNCLGEELEPVATGCGTRVPSGLNFAYQAQVSPDGKNVYSVAVRGDLIESSRNPSTGALSVIGCVTAGTDTCAAENEIKVPEVAEPAAVVISPDGKNAYVIAQHSSSVIEFSRDPQTGLLAEIGCVTHQSSGECVIENAKGLELPYGITMSPDGANVYVASLAEEAIAEFSRNTTTGELTQLASPNECASSSPSTTCGTAAVGLKEVIGLAVSPDGKNLYASAGAKGEEGSVAAFDREASTGALKQLPGTEACVSGLIAGCTPGEAIEGSEDLVVSPDGNNLYANSFADNALIELRRNQTTGAIAQLASPNGCLTTAAVGVAGGCTLVKSISRPLGVAISPEGANVYVSSASESAEAAFERNGETGALTQLPEPYACVTSNASGCGSGSTELIGLEGARRVTVSPDGANVYVAGQNAHAIVELARVPKPVVPASGTSPNPGTTSPLVAFPLPIVRIVSPPVLAKTGNVAPVKGSVLVELPGSKTFVSLASLTQIPFGTVIETTNGTVSVTTANPNGTTQTGQFFGGQFILTQGKNGLVVAKLGGGNFSVCPTVRERTHRASASVVALTAPHAWAAASGKHVVRKLWANAHGKFSTQGNYAAGAVQGTEWLTEDLCEGTLIKVTRDKVAVTNLVNHKHVEVKTGHKYLAKAP